MDHIFPEPRIQKGSRTQGKQVLAGTEDTLTVKQYAFNRGCLNHQRKITPVELCKTFTGTRARQFSKCPGLSGAIS